MSDPRKYLVSRSRSTSLDNDKQTFFETLELAWSDIPSLITSGRVWSAITWERGERRAVNFVQASLSVIDIDDGLTLSEAKDWCEETGVRYIIGATKNHQLPKHGGNRICDRFRLVMDVAAPCTVPGDYYYTQRILGQVFAADVPASSGLAMSWQPCTRILAQSESGICGVIGWLKDLSAEEKAEKEMARKAEKERRSRLINGDIHKLPPWVRSKMYEPSQRNNNLYQVSAFMKDAGFETDAILQELIRIKSPLLGIGIDEAKNCIENAGRYSR